MSWSVGSGNGRVVLAKEGSAVDAFPQDFSFYAWSDTIGNGQEIGTGNFVVYEGSGNKASVVGLKKDTKYYFAVIEYNSNSSGVNYLTSSGYAKSDTTTENITADFSIADAFQCIADNEFVYTNKSKSFNGDPLTYNWEFGDKSTSSSTNPKYTYTTGGIFKVKLTVSSTGCQTSVIKEDTVVVPFVTSFELDPAFDGNDSIQCLDGNNFKLKSTSYPPPIAYGGGGDRTNYLYKTSDGQSRQVPTVSFKFTTPGIKYIKLYTTRKVNNDPVGCVDSAEKAVVVLQPPLAPGDVKISDSILCLGQDNFTFEHTGDNVISQVWYFGDNDSGFNNPQQHTYGKVGRFPIDLKVTDSDGCKDTYTDTVEVITIPNNTFTGLDPEYCLGDPIATLDPYVPGGYFEGGQVNPADSTFNPNALGKFEIWYIVEKGSCRDTAKRSTEVFAVPEFDLGPDTILCVGTDITFDIGLPGLSYLWNDGTTNQTDVVNSPGVIWGQASDGKCDFRDSVNIEQISPPSFKFGPDTTLCGGLTVELSVVADKAKYMWNDGLTDASRTVTESGYYELTVSNACSTVTDGININILPFACEVFVPSAFSPNSDHLNDVFAPTGYFEFERMEIYNRWGERLYVTEDLTKGWDGTYQGAVVPLGTYFYIITYQIISNGTLNRESISGPVQVVR